MLCPAGVSDDDLLIKVSYSCFRIVYSVLVISAAFSRRTSDCCGRASASVTKIDVSFFLIKSFQSGYNIPLHGSIAAKEITIETMREECPHFRSWIDKLVELGQ